MAPRRKPCLRKRKSSRHAERRNECGEGRGRALDASKNDTRHSGYKNHVKVDSRVLGELIAQGAPTTYADSADTGERCEKIFAERKVTFKPMERACRNKPLNGSQKRCNQSRSKVRVRVEHVFATMRMCMRRGWNRCIGLSRNRAAVALSNLVYNMVRFEQIERLGLKNWRVA